MAWSTGRDRVEVDVEVVQCDVGEPYTSAGFESGVYGRHERER